MYMYIMDEELMRIIIFSNCLIRSFDCNLLIQPTQYSYLEHTVHNRFNTTIVNRGGGLGIN